MPGAHALSDPLPPRDARLTRVAHLLPPLAVTGLLATFTAPPPSTPEEGFVVSGTRAGLVGLLSVYLVVLGAVRTGHHGPARRLLLTAWTLFPGSLLLLHRPGLPDGHTIALWGIALTMTGLVAMGAIALERARWAVPWALAVVLTTVACGTWSARLDPDFDLLVMVTGLGMSGVLLLVGVASLHAVVVQLEEHVNAVDLQAREAAAMQHTMRLAMQRAQASDIAKSRFLANMSHELRTPLTAIIGYAELALEDQSDTGTVDPGDLARVESAGRHLLGVVDAILDLSRVEAGRLEVRPSPFAASTPLESAADAIRPLARERGLTVILDTGPSPVELTTDLALVRQILINLATNAVRYTEEGTVTLGYRPDGDGVVYTVADTGRGIGEDQLPRLFQPFERGGGDLELRSGGVGLGLAITRSLCEALGATLAVHSVEGEGSTFSVRVPPLRPAPPPD